MNLKPKKNLKPVPAKPKPQHNKVDVKPITGATVAVYEGEYEVTPKLEKQTLETKNKLLNKDVTIKEVPVYKVRNNSGGFSVYVAKEM